MRTQANLLVPVVPSFPVKAIVDQETATCSPDQLKLPAYRPVHEQYVSVTVRP